LRRLSVKRGRELVLREISFFLNEGELVGLLGPNASGKTTLALTLAGHPQCEIVGGKIYWRGQDFATWSPEKRVRAGIFLVFQHPPALPGVSMWQLLQSRRQRAAEVWAQARNVAKQLDLPGELLSRSLHRGFSGGEQKKMELFSLLMYRPRLGILDEPDSGLDLDAQRKVARLLARIRSAHPRLSLLLITHSIAFLRMLAPQRIFVLREGSIKQRGGLRLLDLLEQKGFQHL
jgi:Fe-S cluster assembly ATP-binding protein